MDNPPDITVVEITDYDVVMSLSSLSTDNGRPGSVTIAVVPEHLDRALELSGLSRSVNSSPKIKEPRPDNP